MGADRYQSDACRERHAGRAGAGVGAVTAIAKLRSGAGILLVVLVSVDVIGAAGQAAPVPPRDPRPETERPLATTAGVIRGRVVRAGSGAPVRRVVIDVVDASSGIRVRQAFSGADGRYEVADLPSGDYTIRASRNGFVS